MAATTQQAKLFLRSVITPTLQAIGLWSYAAEELLLGTAIQESDLIYRRQLRGGPARGLFQMEPATHDDIWQNYLRHQPKQAVAVRALLSKPGADRIVELELNDCYACAMARVHYRRVPEALPAAGDVHAMAEYWKQYYNTMAGAGKPADYINKWNRAMNNSEQRKTVNLLGDGPVQQEYKDQLMQVAKLVDKTFNGDDQRGERKIGWVLMAFPFNEESGRCNYMSNAGRDDVKALLKEQLARFEGMPEASGSA